MTLKNINPTSTSAWKKLVDHFNDIENISIRDLHKDENRKNKFSIELDDLLVDFSNNRITSKTISLLVDLANEIDLKDAIEKQFSGAIINETENRAVLHTALRSNSEEPILVHGKNIKPQIQAALRKLEVFQTKLFRGNGRDTQGCLLLIL
jgi:glucose-6-phosphate isomerase